MLCQSFYTDEELKTINHYWIHSSPFPPSTTYAYLLCQHAHLSYHPYYPSLHSHTHSNPSPNSNSFKHTHLLFKITLQFHMILIYIPLNLSNISNHISVSSFLALFNPHFFTFYDWPTMHTPTLLSNYFP
jgi:hypothetical protein